MITISNLKQQIEEGSRPLDLVNEAILRLQNSAQFNTIISGEEMFKLARERAELLEIKFNATGKKGELYGIPFVVKDNFLITDTQTTAASNILKNFKAPYTATVVQKLESEGAICIAKANMDSFGHGSSTENSDFAPTLNPHDQTRVPGGSSGGSAALVALGVVPFALGTDTGGSIRQPASFCGVYGLKPSYGLVSRNGVVAMASSTDCIGPLASSTEDLNLILDIISGEDLKDSTTIAKPESILSNPDASSAKKYKIAVIKETLDPGLEGLNPEVRQKILEQITKLKQSGVKVEEISIPEVKYALPAYYVIVPAEISSNLSRYDGIRYGLKSVGAKDLTETYQKTRAEGFNSENKLRILIGTYVLSSGYYDAYYKKAQQVRTLLIQAFDKAFEKYDILITPVAPTTAFKFGQSSKDPLQMYLGDIMTVGPSLAGLPAISVPVGFGSTTKMPVGLQMIAQRAEDQKLLNLSKLLEKDSK